ncbi:DoxX family membrane protein [Candidatus Berkelbacteria bacterium]|nr:DoxX family membrane protein [Candidatus Berkelbacteria bacterium]
MAQKPRYWLGVARISLGLIFFWAFVDKLFGLGFSTEPAKAWIIGNSPTESFLLYATKGPFAFIFQMLAGNSFVDWLFMLGLFGVGLALIFGIGLRLACYSGALMLALMYIAGFMPPKNHPFLDDHIIYIILLWGLAVEDAGRVLGFGAFWQRTELVRKFPILE